MKINKETFIISDTHLGHKNILNHCKSRVLNMKFKKYIDHEKWIRDNWNFMVKNENIRFKPIKLEEIIKSRMKKS